MRSGLTVIVLSNVPESVRGYTSVYFVEVQPCVYVGRVSKLVRDRLWETVVNNKQFGAATMVYTDDSEQGYRIETHRSRYVAQNFDGIHLIERKATNRSSRLGGKRLSEEVEYLLNLENSTDETGEEFQNPL